MYRRLLSVSAIFISFQCYSQYKNDDQLYKTVYPKDLCKAFKEHPGFVLIDVRSSGEYGDSSSSAGLNLGHLNGAVNMDIRQLDQHIKEISSYKDKPVFVYCSHSQRSRRASKLLADSGFQHVYNINGGITAMYLEEADKECIRSMIISNNDYAVLSPEQLCNKISTAGNQVFLLDVRSDSAWNHISLNAGHNAIGSLRGSMHYSFENLKSNLNKIPVNKDIVITDLQGGDAAKAAKLLTESGYNRVSILIEGMSRWLAIDRMKITCNDKLYVPAVKYSIMSAVEYARFYPSAKNLAILDVRTDEEFRNQHTLSYRNIGHLKNAIHIPAANLEQRISELEKYKSVPVIVYEFSGGPDAYSSANRLFKKGFKNVIVLSGGIFGLRWTASNVQGMYMMHQWVEAVPLENQ